MYEKDDKFNALMRCCSSLPFVRKKVSDEVFVIFEDTMEKLESEKLKEFSRNLIDYLNNQWRHGNLSTQEWNF